MRFGFIAASARETDRDAVARLRAILGTA
jgi:hypothetical protein